MLHCFGDDTLGISSNSCGKDHRDTGKSRGGLVMVHAKRGMRCGSPALCIRTLATASLKKPQKKRCALWGLDAMEVDFHDPPAG